MLKTMRNPAEDLCRLRSHAVSRAAGSAWPCASSPCAAEVIFTSAGLSAQFHGQYWLAWQAHGLSLVAGSALLQNYIKNIVKLVVFFSLKKKKKKTQTF